MSLSGEFAHGAAAMLEVKVSSPGTKTESEAA